MVCSFEVGFRCQHNLNSQMIVMLAISDLLSHIELGAREARLAEWLRRRGANLGVPGSTPGAGNSLAVHYRPLSKAVKCKITLAPNLISRYLLFGWRQEGHPAIKTQLQQSP